MALDKNDLKAIGSLMDSKIDDLKTLVQIGFVEQGEKIDLFRSELNNKIDSVHDDLNNKIDSVHDNLNNKIDNIADDLTIVKNRTLEDDDALSSDIIKVVSRVGVLENKVKKLKLSKV